ncbi:transglutaminase-like domain-containing protein [Thermodesulfobacteriota bacterium]
MEQIDEKYLTPTSMIDSDHSSIVEYAREITEGMEDDPLKKAVKLYYAVRDGIWYDPYLPFFLPEHFRASITLKNKTGFCIPKAALLCALARTCGIPARLGFATVRNHLATRQLLEHQGSDLFVYHGNTQFFLENKWVIATPAFNVELCERHHVEPLEFTGREDSLFHPYNLDKKQFMEYVEYHGFYADVPIDKIVAAFKKEYGEEYFQNWMEAFHKSGGKSIRDFYSEDVIT